MFLESSPEPELIKAPILEYGQMIGIIHTR